MRKLYQISLKSLTALCLAFSFVLSGYAATQGTLGATSTGDLAVEITIDGMVSITSIDDITLNPATTSVAAGGTTDVCVYSNNSTGLYGITATSDNPVAGAFNAADGANLLPYTVKWGATTLASGTKLSSLTGADSSDPTCGGSSNVTLSVTFAPADMQAVNAAVYTDTITLLLEPS